MMKLAKQQRLEEDQNGFQLKKWLGGRQGETDREARWKDRRTVSINTRKHMIRLYKQIQGRNNRTGLENKVIRLIKESRALGTPQGPVESRWEASSLPPLLIFFFTGRCSLITHELGTHTHACKETSSSYMRKEAFLGTCVAWLWHGSIRGGNLQGDIFNVNNFQHDVPNVKPCQPPIWPLEG